MWETEKRGREEESEETEKYEKSREVHLFSEHSEKEVVAAGGGRGI